MLRIFGKSWAGGVSPTLKRSTGWGTASSARILFIAAVAQAAVFIMLVVGTAIFLFTPAGRETMGNDFILAFLALIIIGSLGYFLISRYALSRMTVLVQQQNYLMSEVSHELRTPLTIMKTGVEVALRHPGKIDAQETLRDTLDELTRMQALVEGILTLSKVERRVLPVTGTFVLNRLLEEVVRKLGPYATSKNVTLTIPDRTRELPDIHVAGDWLRMLEVFLNIVRNSIEYSKPGGGEVVVKVSRYLTPKVATVKITDYGVGIPLEHQPAVFTPFYRSDKTKTKTAGSGLGLAIAKSIVEEAGGSIKLTSIENVRTTVAVNLRRVEPETEENQESGKAEELSRRS